jgi:hypothetical protein
VAFISNQRNHKILSWGINDTTKNPSIHAEMQACYNLMYTSKKFNKSDLRGNKILIVLKISKSGIISNSLPCLSCSSSIFKFINKTNLNFKLNISKVYYSNYDSSLSGESPENLIKNEKIRPSSGDSRTRKLREYKKK